MCGLSLHWALWGAAGTAGGGGGSTAAAKGPVAGTAGTGTATAGAVDATTGGGEGGGGATSGVTTGATGGGGGGIIVTALAPFAAAGAAAGVGATGATVGAADPETPLAVVGPIPWIPALAPRTMLLLGPSALVAPATTKLLTSSCFMWRALAADPWWPSHCTAPRT